MNSFRYSDIQVFHEDPRKFHLSRDFEKQIRHGMNYGSGPQAFIDFYKGESEMKKRRAKAYHEKAAPELTVNTVAKYNKRQRDIDKAYDEGYRAAVEDRKKTKKEVVDNATLEMIAQLAPIAEAQTRMVLALSEAIKLAKNERS